MIAAEVSEHARGQCKGAWKEALRYAMNSCTNWRKWGALAPADPAAVTPRFVVTP
jgi:hypothetical protein